MLYRVDWLGSLLLQLSKISLSWYSAASITQSIKAQVLAWITYITAPSMRIQLPVGPDYKVTLQSYGYHRIQWNTLSLRTVQLAFRTGISRTTRQHRGQNPRKINVLSSQESKPQADSRGQRGATGWELGAGRWAQGRRGCWEAPVSIWPGRNH